MKKQRERAYVRAQYRGNARRFKKVSREAEDIRARHDLCRHADERKIYRTIEERDNDRSPPLLCDNPECGKRRLRIAVFLKAAADLPIETAEVVLTHFLGQGEKDG
jgi:hypothetical protein